MTTANNNRRQVRQSHVRLATLSGIPAIALHGLLGLALLAGGWTDLKADVLIIGAPYDPVWNNDVQSKIAGTGLIPGSVDVFNGAINTPTLALLQSYDAVLVFSDHPFADTTTLGNVLADYVDGGGGVVQATFAFASSSIDLGGRWSTQNYGVWQPGFQDQFIELTLGTIHVPGHPILAGVSSFSGGGSSFHNTVGALNPGAIAIADWSNGRPLVAVTTSSFAGGVAGLNFYPPSSDARADFWDSSTDGDLLMANALIFVGCASAGEDCDGDGIPGDADNCPFIANPDQLDTDGDGRGDACDACPNDPNNDADHDGLCGDVDSCPLDPDNDADGDGLCGDVDPCPNAPGNDLDGDGVCDDVDNCPGVFNPDQADSDGGGKAYTLTRLADEPIVDPDTLGGERPLIICDDCETLVSFEGGTFNIFGTAQSSAYVSSNGFLQFPSGSAVAILAADLYPPSNPSGYRANLLPDRFVVTWRNIPYFGGGGNVTFQLTLHFGSGAIELNYDTLDALGGFVGISPTSLTDTGFDFAGLPIGASLTFGPLEPVGRTYSQFSVLDSSRFRFMSGDGLGDACDPCPDDPTNDGDADGVCGNIDNCPDVANADQTDSDGDGRGDACDACPLDPADDADQDGLCADVDPCPTDPANDVDGDGLCEDIDPCPNDPSNDSDGDGVCGNVDNCPTVFNPSQSDGDGDGRGDACDPCPADPADDADADGFCADGDNCPGAANPDQTDGDADSVGDACDICVDISNPGQNEQTACLHVAEDGGDCLETRIDLIGEHVSGTVTIADDLSVPPDSLRFELLDSSCAPGDFFVFLLNGYLLGNLAADPSNGCTCRPQMQSFFVTDQALLAAHWNVGGSNSLGFRKLGSHATFAWVRVVVNKHLSQQTSCLLDIDGGECTEPDLCVASYTFEPITTAVSVLDGLTGLVPVIEVPFTDSALPDQIDVSSLENRQYSLCVDAAPDQAGLLYASSREGTLVTLDLATGQGSFVGNMPYESNEIEYNPATGRAFSQLRDGVFQGLEIDLATASAIGPLIYDAGSYTGLEWVGPQLYGTVIYGGGGPSELRILDPSTGASSFVGGTGRGPISGLAYDETSGVLYGIDGGGGSASLLTINRATGAVTVVGSTGFQAGSLEFGPDGALYGGGTGFNAGQLFRINPSTGAATLVGYTGLSSVTGLTLAGAPHHSDCRTFTRQGERAMTINGASCGGSPTAAIAGTATVECTAPSGANVLLDGSTSTDPDSTPGTNDDIVSYEWFENFGQPGQTLLGQGVSLNVALAFGDHLITLRVTDRTGLSDIETASRNVVDTIPPVVTTQLSPTSLWPANHRMVEIVASVTAQDACGGRTVVLVSVTSSEPDNAPGGTDGNTSDDIQEAAIGTQDFQLKLRAERDATGSGRTYTVAYRSTDDHGNGITRSATVTVERDRNGVTDPLSVSVRKQGNVAVVTWTSVPGALYYNVVRGDVSNLRFGTNVIDLGSVTCLAGHTQQLSVSDTGPAVAPGHAMFYLVEYNDGHPSSYGSPSSSMETVVTPAQGACP